MDYITSKVFVIAVGIFVTLAIVTGVLFIISSVNDIFNVVENTNTSIIAQYDNIYSQYNETTLNTVGLLNTLRKYETEEYVDILASLEYGKDPEEFDLITIEERIENGLVQYETLYNVSVREENERIYITFEIK